MRRGEARHPAPISPTIIEGGELAGFRFDSRAGERPKVFQSNRYFFEDKSGTKCYMFAQLG